MNFLLERQIQPWNALEKWVLRVTSSFFILSIFPLDWKFYQKIFSTSWLQSSFYDVFELTTYVPHFVEGNVFLNWTIILLVAIVVGTIWYVLDKKKEADNDQLYYYLRVLLRYRLAFGVAAFGLIKLFPLQMPYPSLSNMMTNYGDFLPWKIYFHTLGIAQPYEVFFGAVELIAGLLLLNRKTVIIGAGILVGFTGNVFASNIAYQIGHIEYSLFLTIIALILVWYDTPRLIQLFLLESKALANKFQPNFDGATKKIRTVLKSLTWVYIIILGVLVYRNYTTHPYKYPQTPGIEGTYGLYNVSTFKLNNEEIPYSQNHQERWQNVVFEKWATISIQTAKPIVIDNSNGEVYEGKDIDRVFESAGIGGRRYFAYDANTAQHAISLANKNPHHKEEKFNLTYEIVDPQTIIVSGVNEKNDSIYAVLDKIERKYMLYEGRRKPVKL